MKNTTNIMVAIICVLIIGAVGYFLNKSSARNNYDRNEKRHQQASRAANEYFKSGVDSSNKGYWAQAIAAFNRAIDLDPKVALYYAGRANAYMKTGKTREAIADFTKAIRIMPRDAVLYYNRSNAYMAANEGAKALSDIRRAESMGFKIPKSQKIRTAEERSVAGGDGLKLTGIIYDEAKGYLAIVNDDIVKVGAVVNKAKVIDITQDYVQFDYKGKIVTKKISPEVKADEAAIK